MFEAKLSEGVILKKIVDSIKDIVTDVNIDISPNGKWTNYSTSKIFQCLRKPWGGICGTDFCSVS